MKRYLIDVIEWMDKVKEANDPTNFGNALQMLKEVREFKWTELTDELRKDLDIVRKEGYENGYSEGFKAGGQREQDIQRWIEPREQGWD